MKNPNKNEFFAFVFVGVIFTQKHSNYADYNMFSNYKINLPLGTLLILRNLRCDYSQQIYRYSMPAEFFTRIKVSPKHPFSAAEYCVNSHNYSLSSYSGLTLIINIQVNLRSAEYRRADAWRYCLLQTRP